MKSSLPAVLTASTNSGVKETPEDGIVHAVYQAYQHGRLLPRVLSKSNWKAEWQERLKIHTHGSQQEQLMVLRCAQLAGKARASAGIGDIAVSCQLFGFARSLGDRKELSEEGRLRCRLEVAAAEAYLDYYCGDFEQAQIKLFESLSAAQELEDRFGYELLHVHRIHLLNNLVKVRAREGHLTRAMELAAKIILYLQDKAIMSGVPGSWGAPYSRHLRMEDRQFLSGQLVAEIAAAVIAASTDELHHAFTLLLDRVDMDQFHPSWQPESYVWVRLKALRETSNDLPGYARRCLRYLEQGPGKAPLLWHLTALDVATACENLEKRDAAFFKYEVLTDIKAMHSLPRNIRTFIDRNLAGVPTECETAREPQHL